MPTTDTLKEKARRWFNSLSTHRKYELGDQLVLGTFDWRDWLNSKPEPGFLREVDRERMYWESEAE